MFLELFYYYVITTLEEVFLLTSSLHFIMTTIDHLSKKEQSWRNLLASRIATEAIIRYGYQEDEHTKQERAKYKNDIFPKMKMITDTNPLIKDMVDYFTTRSYGWKHLLYIWHLYQCDPSMITGEVFNHLMSGNLEDLNISYQEVMDQYGI